MWENSFAGLREAKELLPGGRHHGHPLGCPVCMEKEVALQRQPTALKPSHFLTAESRVEGPLGSKDGIGGKNVQGESK